MRSFEQRQPNALAWFAAFTKAAQMFHISPTARADLKTK
jgi:hypothetical protein